MRPGKDSRRTFLKRAALGLIASSIPDHSLSASVAPASCFDRDLQSARLPPGIFYCRDRALMLLYSQQIAGFCNRWGNVGYRMRSEFNGYFDDVIVKPWSRNIEPAFHVMSELMTLKSNYSHINNSRSNSDLDYTRGSDSIQMREFEKGLHAFFLVRYKAKEYYDSHYGPWGLLGSETRYERASDHVEASLVRSILHAAFVEEIPVRCTKRVGDNCLEYSAPLDSEMSETEARRYLQSGAPERENILKRAGERLVGMEGGDRESRDPYDPYNRQLVAAWSAYFLKRHYVWLSTSGPKRGNGIDGLWPAIVDYLSVPLIDVVGYNIEPFKGQARYWWGHRTQETIEYTERRYFDTQG